ncbi:hypothetical protein GCK32_000397 [Trichostrongylus colubriformis]|uniref:Uncharacterized protein n=1 Tax=Trichostrongylus colubriformis TaxID=6319 RepID=A0AAN8IET0_TRICO
MEDQKAPLLLNRPAPAYDVLLEHREQLRQMILDGDVRCLLRPNAMTAYCEHLLHTRSSHELSLPFGEFRRQETLHAQSHERTKFEMFWNEINKYLIFTITAVDEMVAGQVLNLICQVNDVASSVTLHVDFPCPPPSSCFVMYSKQERTLNKHLTDDEIKRMWDSMLPKHRIPLFEQYKLELTTFVKNVNDFLIQAPQLSEQQKAHTRSIITRTSAAIEQVNEILSKLKMKDIAHSVCALKYFKEKIGSYYNDIPDDAEREETIQKEFETLPKRVVAWMASSHLDA